jgi:hypothetical protein
MVLPHTFDDFHAFMDLPGLSFFDPSPILVGKIRCNFTAEVFESADDLRKCDFGY